MKRLISLFAVIAAFVPIVTHGQTCPPSFPAAGVAKAKISRNFYRVPYADGTLTTMGSLDYFGHNPVDGSMDMHSIPTGALLVAPADGIICLVNDAGNDCGCWSMPGGHPIGGCGNVLGIIHANGEASAYLHVQQHSVRNAFGVADPQDLIGLAVVKGQVVAREGDVGRTCGSTSPPRFGTCITEAEASGLGNCGSHVHWNIRRVTTGEMLQPMTCNTPTGIYAQLVQYTANSCVPQNICNPAAPAYCCSSPQSYSGVVLDSFGECRVYQNSVSITATSFEVRNMGSAVFHAGDKVRLLPGFKAGSGNGYFRAEIGPCNETAPNP